MCMSVTMSGHDITGIYSITFCLLMYHSCLCSSSRSFIHTMIVITIERWWWWWWWCWWWWYCVCVLLFCVCVCGRQSVWVYELFFILCAWYHCVCVCDWLLFIPFDLNLMVCHLWIGLDSTISVVRSCVFWFEQWPHRDWDVSDTPSCNS